MCGQRAQWRHMCYGVVVQPQALEKQHAAGRIISSECLQNLQAVKHRQQLAIDCMRGSVSLNATRSQTVAAIYTRSVWCVQYRISYFVAATSYRVALSLYIYRHTHVVTIHSVLSPVSQQRLCLQRHDDRRVDIQHHDRFNHGAIARYDIYERAAVIARLACQCNVQ